jgi:hypothetical protein
MYPLLRILPVIVALACQAKPVDGAGRLGSDVRSIPQAARERLAQKRIYFGHQSVGTNIAKGVEALGGEYPDLRLRLAETRSPGALVDPVFAHAMNGRNGDPLGKIADFVESLERGGLGSRADIAFFKFCYVDFGPGTDVEGIFAEYRSTMARLRRAFPNVTFVHVTTPLTVVQSGPRALLKKILGQRLGGAEANIVRHRFNTLMRQEYAGREPLFDLAAVESTAPGGRAVTFRDGGASYPALASEYSSDGKHLNAKGARWAAAHLLGTLAEIAD